MKRAVFPGSFNPFTRGHAAIVERALKLFDEVIIAFGCNPQKETFETVQARADKVEQLYSENKQVQVAVYQSLTTDFAESVGADCIVRGVRNVADFEYERQMADVNRMLTGIETVLLFATPDVAHISSSMVRELQHFGKDVSTFLP